MNVGKKERTTLTQVAEAVGVSIATVSKVLNGRSDVAADTRLRVQAALTEHNYRGAAHTGGRASGLIDLVLPPRLDDYAIEIFRGVELAAHELGVGVVVSVLHERDGQERLLEALSVRRSEGILLVISELLAAHRRQLAQLGVPFVEIDPEGQPARGVTSVGTTHWSGALDATNHLLELGHRRIAAIAGPRRQLCSAARIGGYRSALEGAGIEFDSNLVQEGDFGVESGYLATLSILDQPKLPTALFAGNDHHAFGALRAARERGLLVPRDLSIVGFDDLPVGRWITPSLTTVRQPLADMGGMATRMLMDLSEGGMPGRRVDIATQLIVRETTTVPRATPKASLRTVRAKAQ